MEEIKEKIDKETEMKIWRIKQEAKKRAYALERGLTMPPNYPDIPVPRSLKEVAEERFWERELEKDAPSTGYSDLDKIIKGFVPGHVYTLTGVTNVGKSTIAANFSVRVAKQGKKVLYFALEPENTIADYIASIKSGKKFDEVTQDDLEADDGNIHIFGKEEIDSLNDLVKVVENSERYDLIIIDHIGYFIHSQTNWIQEQSATIKTLAGLAKKKSLAILIIAHLRKRPAGQRRAYVPTSEDIAGSGSFQQDSTEVMIITRDMLEGDGVEYSDTGRLYVTKTKAGPNGNIILRFTPFMAKIESLGEAIDRKNEIEKEKSGYEKISQENMIKSFDDVAKEIDEKF